MIPLIVYAICGFTFMQAGYFGLSLRYALTLYAAPALALYGLAVTEYAQSCPPPGFDMAGYLVQVAISIAAMASLYYAARHLRRWQAARARRPRRSDLL